jgi:isoleucyl-tRNA synthetase
VTIDYKSTVFLPRTEFPMKAGLPALEPRLLERWEKIGLFNTLRDRSKGRQRFVLHDGPPYANGNIHLGTALNKILKDIINRGQQMLGKDAHYVPGWDCHGLPIEWKIEEQYRAAGKNKDEVPILQLREECRRFAEHWLDVQRGEFKRLGVLGDWDRRYATMDFKSEAIIAAELHKFAMNGLLFRGAKPVMWSVVEKTGLAEAEVEYHDHTSMAIWVKFPIVKAVDPALDGAFVVIWTTTPWTMPGNRAIAYGPALTYRLYQVDAVAEGSLAKPGDRLVLAEGLAQQAMDAAKVTQFVAVSEALALDGIVCAHPWRGQGYDFDVPLLPGDFVAADTGTGFVHIAPGHGEDDWHLGMAHGIEVPETVLPDGTYAPALPLFAGLSVLAQGKDGKYYSPAERPVMNALKEVGALLANARLVHSYPHSWRSKAPLIFRTTPQWFIAMDRADGAGKTLRDKALAAIDATRFVPAQGRNRLRGMIEARPDWLVSRQRAWGVPIAIFVEKKTGKVLLDEAVNARIADAFAKEGADAWFVDGAAARFLGPGRKPDDFEQVKDILDVWFESGCTHVFVLESNDWGLPWPADLYLEGSDQHRGWFHSSLLESCGTRGRAPYDAILTHGFVLDEKGYKQSKSLGNTVAPQDVVAQSGADILRLWAASSDYAEDMKLGPEVLKTQVDTYRRLRNTLRYLLGAIDGFDAAKDAVAEADLPPLERWVLHRLWELDGLVRRTCDDFQYHTMFAELHNFCAIDLSAFYFDIRKDSLYCDHPEDLRRRAARTAMARIFDHLVRWLAPILCFTAEEAWIERHKEEGASVHLETFAAVPAPWRDDALAERWATIRAVRRVVTGALEVERAAKHIGSALEAAPQVFVTPAQAEALQGIDLAEIAITSAISVEVGPVPAGAFTIQDVAEVGVVFAKADGEKCVRCWRVLPEVGHHGHDGLCGRCSDAVERLATS